jgi:hypothetical protein
VARSVADFARNAGHVDGFDAVGPRAGDRGGDLVATDRAGHLPNDIIKRALDSRRLGGRKVRAYQLRCAEGSIGGFASVPEQTGDEWAQVDGYGLTLTYPPLPRKPPRRLCTASSAYARRLSVGTYEVALTEPAFCGDFENGRPGPASVTVSGDLPLVAAVRAGECDEVQGRVHLVRIFDLEGTPTDAAFTLTLLEPAEIFLP